MHNSTVLLSLFSSHRLCRPEDIQKELDEYNRPLQIEEERSVNDCLEDTEAFVDWAARKCPRYDPENRRPTPVRIEYSVHFDFVEII